MKQLILKSKKSITLLFIAMVSTMMLFAQDGDKKVDINVNTKTDNGNFFASPWVWVVGGAVFIIILVALMRNNSSKD